MNPANESGIRDAVMLDVSGPIGPRRSGAEGGRREGDHNRN